MEDRIPYTYLIGWTNQNTWYFGVRYKKGCHPSDLWDPYKTSSKHVLKFIEAYGEPDIIEVRQTFDTVEAAVRAESYILRRLKVREKVEWLNVSSGSENFCNFGESASERTRLIRAKRKGSWKTTKGLDNKTRANKGFKPIKGRKKGSKTSPEARKSISEKRKGTVIVADSSGNSFRTPKDNPEIGKSLYVLPVGRNRYKDRTYTHSQELRDNQSRIAKNRPTFTCEKCGRVVRSIQNYERHVDSLRCQKDSSKLT